MNLHLRLNSQSELETLLIRLITMASSDYKEQISFTKNPIIQSLNHLKSHTQVPFQLANFALSYVVDPSCRV